ncbi:MAG: phosphoketolase [Candidatus Yanofskybacteria bacterium RIFCSPHIGHO2_01_FULL_41_21]|uniref:Phosphoketolase n=1 Tax=Candidatus Yanofskybacteria bacterium RIFCSPHIGHO2_01_FULL_41_21 TaxID=1802660 RepID=A0A1F8EBB2_9BACT|nr:MAG: phosphoketolase [Candidatus Yanofskybacteria bacterium RIFCSPHIGHO2_01_FULL_41_21]
MADVENIKKYVRAANYISAVQIYLRDNFLLENKLSSDDIKPRLLGHWGTCPGINFLYANLNYLIKKHGIDMMFVLGPGHGFPALQANLYLEGTLQKFYPNATSSQDGLGYLASNFSWPYGFPSHSNPGAPGVILEGGELGYSLSTSYGAVLDNPDLIVTCLIGDGEAETGPTGTAWHLNKFVDSAGNGAVLPVLHLNGYKISGPTVFGRMSNRELKSLFYGYGYEPFIVEGTDKVIYEKMVATLETAYQKIRSIQTQARSGQAVVSPRLPMIILRTPKGWTGIKKLKGEKIEGNALSHQVVAPLAKTDKSELKAVEKWLRSYKFEELFSSGDGFNDEIKSLIPDEGFKMGSNKHAFGGEVTKDLILPKVEEFMEDASVPGTIGSSSMVRTGLYLNEVFKLNKDQANFRLFSPDETYSNKLHTVFQTTARAFTWPIKEWDKDMTPSGRVIEMLSEHSLQGLMQGYALTGRYGIFATYEAFVQIVSSMIDQYAKFLKQAREFPWRGDVPSVNYILTASGWRQEHNGFSHQNPGFIDDVLQKNGCYTHVYFPPDGNTTLAVLERCLTSKNGINVIVAGKTLEPRWLTPELAQRQLEQGMMIWDFASEDNPDIVFSSAGEYLTKEALAAIDDIKLHTPEVRIRFVSILELTSIGIGNAECRIPLNFDEFFTHDKPVIFNFHGYPQTLKQILFDTGEKSERFSVHGYIENGSTTTPFDMHIRNETSRYHLVIDAYEKLAKNGVVEQSKADDIIAQYKTKIKQHGEFIRQNGVDPEEIEQWQWTKKS